MSCAVKTLVVPRREDTEDASAHSIRVARAIEEQAKDALRRGEPGLLLTYADAFHLAFRIESEACALLAALGKPLEAER